MQVNHYVEPAGERTAPHAQRVEGAKVLADAGPARLAPKGQRKGLLHEGRFAVGPIGLGDAQAPHNFRQLGDIQGNHLAVAQVLQWRRRRRVEASTIGRAIPACEVDTHGRAAAHGWRRARHGRKCRVFSALTREATRLAFVEVGSRIFTKTGK